MLIKKLALATIFALVSLVSVSNVTASSGSSAKETVRPNGPVMQGLCGAKFGGTCS